jgi:hypothetical protein
MSDKARANFDKANVERYKMEKPVQPPKSTYVTQSGKEVKIDTSHKSVETIRSKPYSYYAPEAHQQRVNVFVTNNHYSHPYDWYYSRPYYDCGGGFSSAFWWMVMTDWSAQRRAEWLYNNQYRLNQAAYQQGLQDAQVAQEIARLKAQGVQPDPNYIDPQLRSDPSIMYDRAYIDAVYNAPEPVHGGTGGLVVLWWIIGIIVLFLLGYVVLTKIRV